MAHGGGTDGYHDVLVFLAAAGVLVPLLHKLKVSPVLGFLAAGVLLGPDGLGRLGDDIAWIRHLTIQDRSQIQLLSELGVVFLLFMIGLELSWERLRSMRRLVFGLGVAQILVCAVLLGVGFLALGQTVTAAVVLGLALALSSTAVVMPVMAEGGRLTGTTGRTVFSVLLAQDLAVAPILVMVGVLAAGAAAAGDDGGALWHGLLSLGPAVLAVGAIVLLGRLTLRPMFRSVARTRSPEMFVAACLFVVLGAGLMAQVSGLSMGLGALIAGLLLAETEFRREVEIAIDPFKGLLLGVFFVSVGVGLDLDAVAAYPVTVLTLAAALTAVKIGAVFVVARLFRIPTPVALEAALVLGPAGEFAFVIITAAIAGGVAPAPFAHGVLLSATISLFAVPWLAALGRRLRRRLKQAHPEAAEAPDNPDPGPDQGRVLIVGYGRVGRLVGEMLTAHEVSFTAVDSDPQLVAQARREGVRIWYGDAGHHDLLRRLGAEEAAAVVVTMDAPGKVDEVVRTVRALRQDLVLIARARDARHAARLYQLGVTDAVPETVEASLQLAENTLVDLGVPMGTVLASIHERREGFRRMFQEAAPETRQRPARALRSRAPVEPGRS